MLRKRHSSVTQRFPRQVELLADISLSFLLQSDIEGIILDLDNTIISEDDRYLSPYAERWIQQAQDRGLKLFILSNGKRYRRVRLWSNRLNIPAISPARKPLPFGFWRALKTMKLEANQVVMIGDSRHTDVWGAALVGCPCIQVATLPHPPRRWERWLGTYIHRPYPKNRDLWCFDRHTKPMTSES